MITIPQPNNLGSDDKRMRATQTNDPNAALACGSSNGTDRVFESSMHDGSFTSRQRTERRLGVRAAALLGPCRDECLVVAKHKTIREQLLGDGQGIVRHPI